MLDSESDAQKSSDYRPAFYAAYHRALNLQPVRPSEEQLRACVRQYGGRWDRWLPRDRAGVCLDVGCGTGEFLYYLKHRGFRSVMGVDLSAEELAIARSIGIERVQCENALEFIARVPPESLSLISAFNFFEHLTKSEILEFLPRAYAALQPGGTLLAVTPNGLSPFAGATRYWDFSHETGFTPASWRQLARLSGFADVAFEEYGPLPHSWRGVIRCAAWYGFRVGIMAAAYVETGGPRDPSGVVTADMKVILRR